MSPMKREILHKKRISGVNDQYAFLETFLPSISPKDKESPITSRPESAKKFIEGTQILRRKYKFQYF